MIYVEACQVGVFALDDEMKVVASATFPQDPETIAERLRVLEKGMKVPELEEVLSGVDDDEITTSMGFESDDFTITRDEDSPAATHVTENVRELAVEAGFVEKPAELNALLAKLARLRTESRMRSYEDKDRLVSQAVASIDDLAEITNRMSERLHEWYGLYHPELEKEVTDNEEYAKTLANGDVSKPEKSVGMNAAPEDLDAIRRHARRTAELFELRNECRDYLEETMPDVAPNMTEVTGPIMAARLINHAGSLEKLAKMPSSTVQLLGAEKALFRHMKEGGKPPKHGLIFAHPYIQRAPGDKRGKVARALAATISMAAKTDFYSDEDRTERYTRELGEKVQKIMNG